MKVLVLGNGGREHALAWKIGCSGLVEAVFMAPAGSPKEPRIVATALDILDPDAILAFVVTEGVDLVVIGPEAPLVAGIADSLRASGILVFGPGARGAMLEGSKIFAKQFMKKHGIPTADSVVCKTMDEVLQAVEAHDDPYVVKCDGLAAGKGVCVSTTAAQSIDFASEVFRGSYGEQTEVIMEERLHGQEVSVFALLDGTTYALLAPSRDHKRLKEDDTGPNTGGMGAFTPVPGYSTDLHEQIRRSIMDPVMRGLAADKIDYRGLLYVGLILTDDGPKVLEFNCRFGDPETQPLMVAMDDDIMPWLLGASRGRLPAGEPRFREGTALTVVMAAENYPGVPVKGMPISGLSRANTMENIKVFFAGTRVHGGTHVVNGGRVLGVTAFGRDLCEARRRAYEAVTEISFSGMQYRTDIGTKRGTNG